MGTCWEGQAVEIEEESCGGEKFHPLGNFLIVEIESSHFWGL